MFDNKYIYIYILFFLMRFVAMKRGAFLLRELLENGWFDEVACS